MMTELDGHILIASEMLKTVEFKPCCGVDYIFEWYKITDGFYVIHDKNVDAYHFQMGSTPKDALQKVLTKYENGYQFTCNDKEGDK